MTGAASKFWTFVTITQLPAIGNERPDGQATKNQRCNEENQQHKVGSAHVISAMSPSFELECGPIA